MSHLGRIVSLHSDERGAVLVMFALFAPVAILLAAFALDTSNWFVHKRHLQLQADAAVLAAAQAFQPCANESIYKTAGQYGGAASVVTPEGTVTSASPLYNLQTGGVAQSNVHELVNSQTYYGQPTPVDSSATPTSPCIGEMVDVKLTETNVPWYWRAFSTVPYINAHARVEVLQETASEGAEPFAEPLPTPNSMTATLVDESKNATIAGPITLTPSADHMTWTASSAAPVTFANASTGSFPVGLRVCANAGETCYDDSGSNPPIGLTYTRVWSNSGTPGLPLTEPVAPQASDVAIVPAAGSTCPSGAGGVFSNFISSSSSCTVALRANMTFTSSGGTPLSCTNASLTLTAGATQVTVPCPAGGPNGLWTSSAATLAANAGPTSFTLGWKLTSGSKPKGAAGGASGKCTESAACTGSLGVVQRTYTGAYDSQSSEAAGKRAGPILGALLTDASGAEIMSVPRGTAENVNITVSVLGFQNSTEIPSAPIELSFGGNQGNGALACGGSAGSAEFERALAEGCHELFGTTTAPAATACQGSPSPPVCIETNPGGGKLEKDLDKGMNARINEGKATCVNPNRWAAPNSVSQIVAESPKDPRLIITVITDNGAIRPVKGKQMLPVRAFATFYVTGWAGDPCLSQPNGSSNGLAYTHDDNPGAGNTGVLLGHFIKFIDTLDTKETGSGKCDEQSIDRCVVVLTR